VIEARKHDPGRSFDVAVASFFLGLYSPVIGAVAAALAIRSRESIFVARARPGLGGRPFPFVNFRTMAGPVGAPGGERRLTPIGRFIRNYSLDHLPQLINVLRGEMSIVGPRPTEPERLDPADPAWATILSVKPGLLSPAVLLLATRFNSARQYDRNTLEVEYLRRRTFRSDLRLIADSFVAAARSRGNIKARGQPAAGVLPVGPRGS
jgi:lipopolysaccharide/colanic/teichoic acid biosynthesis glycosyltransferase